MRYFVPFLLGLFIIAALFRVDFYFAILYLFLALVLMSRFWMRRRIDRLRVRRRFVDRAFLGDRVQVDLTIQNTGWLPIPWLELHESLPVELHAPPPQGQVISLGPREGWQMRYTLRCRRRGYYPIGPLKLETGDLMGFERARQEHVAPDNLIVYPRVVSLQQLGLPTRSPLVALPARSPLFEDPARVIGVRDYQRGDSPRRIHWTATAGAGQLLVKQYQPAIARETLICLDLDRDDYEKWYTSTELAIVVAASVANHILVREGLAVGLATEAYDPLQDAGESFFLSPRSERAHLMSLLELLARVQVIQDSSFATWLRQSTMRLAWGATLLVITGNESVALYDTLAPLRRAGFAVALILVQPDRVSADLQAQADLLHLPVYRVWREGDLEAWT